MASVKKEKYCVGCRQPVDGKCVGERVYLPIILYFCQNNDCPRYALASDMYLETIDEGLAG